MEVQMNSNKQERNCLIHFIASKLYYECIRNNFYNKIEKKQKLEKYSF